MLKIIIFYFCIFYFSIAEIVENSVFNCPNNGEPKRDIDSGELIQCLPGWSSEAICGPNYSCFFSGFNYQCCPTDGNDELINSKLNNKEVKKSEDERDECPDDALAVLDSAGDVMYCDGAGKCPNAQMFCFSETGVISETSVCCENFFYKDNEQTNKNSEEKPKHVLHSNVAPEDVLEENKSKTFVGSFEQDFAKTTPIATASTTTTKTSTISLLSATTYLVNKSTRIVENKNGEIDGPLKQQLKNKQLSAKTRENGPKYEIYNKEIKEEKDFRINEGQNSEEIDENDSAKNFLLEQIKQGWPYNDKYYREEEPSDAEDIVVLRRRGRPEAIVHFPN